jgi:ubiquinone biosynthesis UbiH/UbiF/VisC/COQ6 family hydroxylase
VGVVATVAHPQNVKNTTSWQRFLPSGPIALLPLHANYSSIVWSTSVSHAEYLMALDDSAFISTVRKAFSDPLSYGAGMLAPLIPTKSPDVPELDVVVGKRGAFPLRFEHALTYTGNRVVLVGDAAHTVHPLAGQGVNLGLVDAAKLASLVVEAAEAGSDIGSPIILEAYERAQKATNHTTMLTLDAIKSAFSLPPPLLSTVRVATLSALDRFPPAKDLIVKWATGT